MLELVEQRLPILKRSVSTNEAIEIFHKYGMYDKEKLFRFRRVSRVNLYSWGILRIIFMDLWSITLVT